MTLIKRAGSNNWYAKIYVSPKRQLWRCLYTTKQKEAQALHDELESQVKAERREQKIARIFTSTAQIASGAARVPLGEIIKKAKQIKEFNEDTTNAALRFIEWLRVFRPDIVHAAQIERAAATWLGRSRVSVGGRALTRLPAPLVFFGYFMEPPSLLLATTRLSLLATKAQVCWC